MSFDINNDLFGENAHKSTSIHPQISVRNLVNSLGEDATIFVRNENRFNEIAGLLSDNPPTLLATIKSVEAMVTHDNIKSQAEISDKKLSIRQDTEYLSVAEKYRDGTATEAETEQLRKIVLRTAEKNGFKQVNFDYETLSNDLFYGRNRIDKNRCGELLQRAKDMEVNGWIGRPMKKRYLRNQFTKYGATVAYKNEALAQVNPQLLEWLETINAEASNDSIPNPSQKSNTSGEKISPQFSIASDEDYLSVAEKYRDGTASEAETEQLRKMVDEAAEKAMQKVWAEGLNTASQNFKSANGTMQSEKNTATEGGNMVRYQAVDANNNVVVDSDVSQEEVRKILTDIFDENNTGNFTFPVLKHTPQVFIDYAHQIGDRSFVMNSRKAYNAMRGDTKKQHGLEVEGMLQVIERLYAPEYIVLQNVGRNAGHYAAIVSINDGETLVAVDLGDYRDIKDSVNGEAGYYNVLITAFNPDENYLDDSSFVEENDILYDKSTDKQYEVPEQVAFGERPYGHASDTSYKNSIYSPSEKSNSYAENNFGQFSISSDSEYISIAEKHRDGTATEAEAEQLRKMVDEAAEKAGYTSAVRYHQTSVRFNTFKTDIQKD